MLFTSFEFFVFGAVVFLFYFFIPPRYKWIFLLAASYFFYGWYKPGFLILLITPTFIIYWVAISISSSGSASRKKWLLMIGISTGLVGLVVYKYLDFLGAAIYDFVGLFGDKPEYKAFNLLLPIGISFYSFKLISYLIDVYNEKLKAERHPGYFALYVSFFPQLMAGPIDRAIDFIPELKKKVTFDYERVMEGFKLITWGFFKKLVIADRLAISVDKVYGNVNDYTGPALITATLFYSIQIYCDFSGYSDIAIGISRVLGFKSMENFNSPYFSKSITKFWNKWHISFSTWLRDYLFLPIAYAVMRRIKTEKLLKIKVESWGYVTGMLITMFLGGLWHGAKWSLVLWGIVHGVYLVFSYSTKKFRKKMVAKTGLKKFPVFYRFIKVFITFNLVSFAWIFFRADTIRDAFYIIGNLHRGTLRFLGNSLGHLIFSLNLSPLQKLCVKIGIRPFDFFMVILAVFILAIFDYARQKNGDIWTRLKTKPPIFRFVIYYLLIMSILLFAVLDGGQFIYFQF